MSKLAPVLLIIAVGILTFRAGTTIIDHPGGAFGELFTLIIGTGCGLIIGAIWSVSLFVKPHSVNSGVHHASPSIKCVHSIPRAS